MTFDRFVLWFVRGAGALSLAGLLGFLPTDTGHADPEWMSLVGIALWASTEWSEQSKRK